MKIVMYRVINNVILEIQFQLQTINYILIC